MKLCKDCRFHDSGNCKHEKNQYVNPITGENNFTMTCLTQRTTAYVMDGELCGTEANWFEPKAPEILNCPEGHRAFVGLQPDGDNRVGCSKNGCWLGPSKPTKEEAIQVWNHMVKSFRNTPDE